MFVPEWSVSFILSEFYASVSSVKSIVSVSTETDDDNDTGDDADNPAKDIKGGFVKTSTAVHRSQSNFTLCHTLHL